MAGKPKSTLSSRWTTLDQKKTDLISRCEQYALWTLPYMFPTTGHKNQEQAGPLNSTGPRAVNHLSNKLVLTLFQPNKPFFVLEAGADVLQQINSLAQQGDQQARDILAELDKEFITKEKEAIKALNYTSFRTEATTTAKALIITGNSMMYCPPKQRVQVFSVRDYCVVRDLSGEIIEIMTKSIKALSTFDPAVIQTLRMADPKKYKDDDTDVSLYTRVKLSADDGKYHLEQAADDVPLASTGSWTKEDLPWIVLAWNLKRGDDYGSGLVEDYKGAFHALYVLDQALVTGVAVAAEIKFLVRPGSMIDVKELNESSSGSYHTGEPDDVSCIQLNKTLDLGLVLQAIERYERTISQAFLLNSAVQRDAERVTAEEIRYVAQELETAHGGVYSRFSEEWQYKLAVLKLKEIGLSLNSNGIEITPRIITGIDSLSRAGELDNFRMFIQDLAMTQNIPEQLLQGLNASKLMAFIGLRRGVDYEKFIKTTQEIQQEQQMQLQQQQQMMAQQGLADVAVEAGKSAVQRGAQ